MSVALEHLKSQLRALGGFHEREYLSGASVPIPKGAITQVTGIGKTECLVEFLAQNQKLRICWIENELSIYPNALLQRTLDLQKTLFVEAGKDFIWATLQVLSSMLFEVVVLSLPFQKNLSSLKDLRTIRRFQLAAEKSKCSLILLSEESLSAWPVSLHLESSREDNQHRWRVIRSRS